MKISGSLGNKGKSPSVYLLPKLYIEIKLDYLMKLPRLKHGGAWQILLENGMVI